MYGSPAAFPQGYFQSSNYLRDIVFAAGVVVNPAVSLVTAINVAGMSRLRPHSATRMSYLADRTFVLDIESGASFGQRIEYGSVPVGRYLVLAIALALG